MNEKSFLEEILECNKYLSEYDNKIVKTRFPEDIKNKLKKEIILKTITILHISKNIRR